MCLEDNTTQTCGGEPGDCRNCYLSIGEGCGPGGVPCAPMIYIAWLGTDKDGRNLLSSGSLLSRFSQCARAPTRHRARRRASGRSWRTHTARVDVALTAQALAHSGV